MSLILNSLFYTDKNSVFIESFILNGDYTSPSRTINKMITVKLIILRFVRADIEIYLLYINPSVIYKSSF